MKKRLCSFVLSLVMLVSLSAGMTASAAYTPQHTAQAETLYELGLFKGTGTNSDGTPIFALEKTATRMQGLIMLIRLLGEEEAALAYEGACPFTDVSGNSAKYAAYAFSKGYTTGTTATTFGNGPLKANAFLTFTLRALGYDDKAGDFKYSTAFLKAAEIGLIAGGECTDQSQGIYRDVCAQVAHNALVTNVKGGGTLVDKLIDAGAVDGKKAEASGILKAQPVYGNNRDHKAYDTALTNMMTAKVNAAVAKDAKYFGLPNTLRWIAEPTSIPEFLNNVYCCFLVGDYSLYNLTVHSKDAAESFARMLPRNLKDMTVTSPELLGAYSNGEVHCGFIATEDGSYYRANMHLYIEDASQTNDEIYQEQNEAMEAAYALSKKMHESGKIKEGMTQRQIAQVYYNYFCTQNIQPSSLSYDEDNRGQYMKYDTVYAALINKVADCMGRCAVFNVMMRIEGISAQSVGCHAMGAPEGDNHVLNRVILDGVEYVCDWGNRLPIQSLQSASSRFEFFESSLEDARALDKGNLPTEPRLVVSDTEFTITYGFEGGGSRRYVFNLADIAKEVPDTYAVSCTSINTHDAQKKYAQSNLSMESLYLSMMDVQRYCSGLTTTLAPYPDKLTRQQNLYVDQNSYSVILVVDKDCKLLAYSVVSPEKKNDGMLVFTFCDYSNVEAVEAAKAANLAEFRSAVQVDPAAFTYSGKNLTADVSKLPAGVKDFAYYAKGNKSGNAITMEQQVRGAIYDVQSDWLFESADYSPLFPYGADNSNCDGSPLGNCVLLLYNADKLLVGYCMLP